MIKSIQSPDNEPQSVLLSANSIAPKIPCTARTVYRMNDTGKLPRPVKLCGMLRWYAAQIDDWLGEVASKSQPTSTERKQQICITVSAVARLMDCSPKTIYRLMDSGRMPQTLNTGGVARWNAAAIHRWIADGCPDCQPAQLRAANHANATAKTTVAKRSANAKRPA